jgi:molybdate-binding protein
VGGKSASKEGKVIGSGSGRGIEPITEGLQDFATTHIKSEEKEKVGQDAPELSMCGPGEKGKRNERQWREWGKAG